MEQAKAKGAMMLFDEKYGDEVRVLSMGDGFSIELCGGVHIKQTGEIGVFHIVSESGVASGVRRIEAVTGKKALSRLLSYKNTIDQVSQLVKANNSNAVEKTEQLVGQLKEQEKTISAMQAKLASADSGDLLKHMKQVAGVNVLAHHVVGANGKVLRDMADALKGKLENSVYLLVTNEDDKVSLVTGVTKDLTARFKAGDLMRHIAPLVGGKGGGRPDMAQGGGTDPSGIQAALDKVEQWVQSSI
jgi:alanyl-tRNA synthetase